MLDGTLCEVDRAFYSALVERDLSDHSWHCGEEEGRVKKKKKRNCQMLIFIWIGGTMQRFLGYCKLLNNYKHHWLGFQICYFPHKFSTHNTYLHLPMLFMTYMKPRNAFTNGAFCVFQTCMFDSRHFTCLGTSQAAHYSASGELSEESEL